MRTRPWRTSCLFREKATMGMLSGRIGLNRFAQCWRRCLQVISLLLAIGFPSAAHAVYSVRDCATCPEMLVLPAGEFMMGSPLTEELRDPDEGPQHRVRIGAQIAVAKYK